MEATLLIGLKNRTEDTCCPWPHSGFRQTLWLGEKKKAPLGRNAFRLTSPEYFATYGRLVDPKASLPGSHEVTVSLRVFRRVPYRIFGSPIPLRCCFRSPLRFSGSRLPRNLTNTVHPLTDFRPSSEHTPLALPLSKAMAYHFFSQGSSHEVLSPPALRH